MGPSGCGKTSLLSILSNRIFSQSHVKISGSVTLNEIPINSIHSSQYLKFVTQEDILFATQTPRESFRFSCKLKAPQLNKNEVVLH
jgi:ABC-type multidrug transport system ATPase subunit